jgi:hypothetical protein
MAANQHSNSDDLSLVSGLYGPGNVLCWYFTLASCLISWTLDRKKRRSDSITVDLMVGITLPIVAVAHLITQIHNYPGDTKQMMTTRDPDLLRLIYAIEAPFTITDIFLTISVLLFLLEFLMICFKRTFTIGMVGLACYLAECYAHVVVLPDLGPTTNFRRSFAAKSKAILSMIAVLVGISTAIAAGLARLFFLRRPRLSPPTPPDESSVDWANMAYTQYSYGSQTGIRLLAYFMVFGLPGILGVLWFLTSLNYTSMNTLQRVGLWQWIHAMSCNILLLFFPRTGSSISDLDQVVSALGGATVLGFSLYRVANSWYKDLMAKEAVRSQQQAWFRMTRIDVQARRSTLGLPETSGNDH